MPPPTAHRLIVLCALEFERKCLERAGLRRLAGVVCVGPGAGNVVRWAEREGTTARRVILAGLAGSLREMFRPGEAVIISTAMTGSGRQFAAANEFVRSWEPDDRPRRATIASSEYVLHTIEQKRAWAERTGADLVDLESAVFAEAGATLGWQWTIVKGVSDGSMTELPPGVEHWVYSDGRTRLWRTALGILRRPWWLGRLMRLRAHSREAMQEVARLVEHVIKGEADTGSSLAQPSKPQPRRVESDPTRAGLPVLIFGGTFDPPHRAHVELPFQVADLLGCTNIVFVPTSMNPLKDERPTAPKHREAMLQCALADRTNWTIDRSEMNQLGPSYTVETVERLSRSLGSPDPSMLRLLMGSDAALSFTRWRDPEGILRLATPVVVIRPPESRESFAAALAERHDTETASRWLSWTVRTDPLDVDATSLRQRLRDGEDVSNLLSPEVGQYIHEHDLYRDNSKSG